MDSLEIRQVVNHSPSLIPFFLGVYARDGLPKIPRSNKFSFLIANTSKASERGVHWVLLCFKNNKAIFYDSFAQSPETYGFEFKLHLKQNSNSYKVNKIQHQDIRSIHCGWFCLYLSLKILDGVSYRKICEKSLYRRQLLRNDKLLKQFFLKRMVKSNS